MNHGEPTLRPGLGIERLCLGLAALGVMACAVGLLLAPARFLPNALVAAYYLLTLSLGGLLFIALTQVTGAKWSARFRRVPQTMAGVLPMASIVLAIVVLASRSLYPWAGSVKEPAQNPLQAAWQSWPFFLVRSLIYLGCWSALGMAIVRATRRETETADRSRGSAVPLSALFLVVFGVTFWLASEDWLMSVDLQWSSTVYSVYQFAGVLLGGLASIIVFAGLLPGFGRFVGVVTRENLHDLGKLLFAFSTFWMYVWFCQYMLIWYVNNPEETSWLVRRIDDGWMPFLVASLALNWLVPFVVLLPRANKERFEVLVFVAAVVLAGRWLDLYVCVLPAGFSAPGASLAWEIGMGLGAAGLFAVLVVRGLGRAALLAVNNAHLLEPARESAVPAVDI
jgi:hypothetical protein